MNFPVKTQKNHIRQAIKAQMAQMTSDEYSRFNQAIHEVFFSLEQVVRATSIMIYHSIYPEVETVSIIQELLDSGKTISLPVCTPSKDLVAVKVSDLSQLITTNYGLREPELNMLHSLESMDLIVLPGMAYDSKGFRLGRGAGYYDRFLYRHENIYKLGLAYDYQFLPQLPVETHDVAVDGLIRPSGFVGFTKMTN